MKQALAEILDTIVDADPGLNRKRLAPSLALLLLSATMIVAAVFAGGGVAQQALTFAAALSLIVGVYLPIEAKRTIKAAVVAGSAAALLILAVGAAVIMNRGGSAQSLELAVVVAAVVAMVPLVAFGIKTKLTRARTAHHAAAAG